MPMSLATPPPFVTVAICTRNRSSQIGGILDTLRANLYPDFRVLVVDQSQDDATEQLVRRLQLDWPRLDYLHLTRAGLSYSRNAAIAAATGAIVAFTDDDCLASNTWVAQIAEAFVADPALDVLFGRVLPDQGLAENQIPVAVQPSRVPRTLTGLPNPLAINLFTLGLGNSMAFRRARLRLIGLFDEMFGAGSPLYGGEDVDILYRALAAGLKVAYQPSVLCYHRMWRGPEQVDTLYLRTHISAGALLAKHLRQGTPGARLYAASRFWYFVVRPALRGVLTASSDRVRRSLAAGAATFRGMRRYHDQVAELALQERLSHEQA